MSWYGCFWTTVDFGSLGFIQKKEKHQGSAVQGTETPFWLEESQRKMASMDGDDRKAVHSNLNNGFL